MTGRPESNPAFPPPRLSRSEIGPLSTEVEPAAAARRNEHCDSPYRAEPRMVGAKLRMSFRRDCPPRHSGLDLQRQYAIRSTPEGTLFRL